MMYVFVMAGLFFYDWHWSVCFNAKTSGLSKRLLNTYRNECFGDINLDLQRFWILCHKGLNQTSELIILLCFFWETLGSGHPFR